jgi:hypothetical protein
MCVWASAHIREVTPSTHSTESTTARAKRVIVATIASWLCQQNTAADILSMLTSFESYDALARAGVNADQRCSTFLLPHFGHTTSASS